MLDIKQIESFYPERLRPFKRSILREYIQYKILEEISQSAFSRKLVFMGGTCIHIVHGNPRFSEDLDFDNTGMDQHAFMALAERMKKKLELQGFRVELKTSLKTTFRASLRFPGLLQRSGISGHRDEKLLIQIDTEPQQFKYNPDDFILNNFDVFARIRVVPPDILLAQKLFCIFNRVRPMGRDFFDVVFLLGKTDVNIGYLKQKMGIQTISDLREKLSDRCALLNFDSLAKDVEPFVFSPREASRITLFPDFIRQAWKKM